MAKILGTLPSKYNAFISAWDSVSAAEQTLLLLRERLIREEAWMTSTDEISSALAATTISTEGKRGRHHRRNGEEPHKKKIVCCFCSKTGHLAKYCFAKKKALKTRDNNKTNGSKCDDSANFAAFIACQATNGSNTENPSHTADPNLAAFLKLDEKHIGLLDSGASRHLCCRREWFTEFTPYNNEHVCLGDNTNLKVDGRGKIFISRLINNQWHDGEINFIYSVLRKEPLLDWRMHVNRFINRLKG
ncbi:uncharacterized protein [Mycetomoellerius zeteki]|uniref:uncharacterized protein n=1 Tax=Mycetomoellerius zeteki TaxID=64791 RepID=UPI00084E8043|nr:PREDICTED: uncharacterized protein LOC108727038 [Trachymyrmex zeteki]